MNKAVMRRRLALGAALLLTLAATLYFWLQELGAALDDSLVVAATALPRAREGAGMGNGAMDTPHQQQHRTLQEVARDIFAVARREEADPVKNTPPVTVPPPPPPAQTLTPAVVPPVPSAPPLPFTYVGKLGEDGRYTVFLSARGRNFAVKAGDMVAQYYRIEAIQPPTLTMTYLPLNIKQTMQIGEAN